MALRRYAGDADSVLIDATGRPLPGAPATLWTAVTGGTQITTVYGSDGTTPISGGLLTGSDSGLLPTFYVSDAYDSVYVDAGRGRLLLQPTDMASRLAAAEATVLGMTSTVASLTTALANLGTKVVTVPTVSPVLTLAGTTNPAVNASWTTVAGADGYNLERIGSGIVYSGFATSFADLSVVAGQKYEYRVDTYVVDAGAIRSEGPWSAVQSVTLTGGSAPSFTITTTATANNAASTATLAWTFSNPSLVSSVRVGRDGKDTTGYGVYTSAQLPPSPASFTFTALSGAYNLTVTAYDATGAILGSSTKAQTVTPTTPPPTGSGSWYSGASYPPAADGRIATWRGEALGIVGTWPQNQTDPPLLKSGAELGSWTKHLDLGVGAIVSGETWANAASGAYVSRWRQQLTALRVVWAARSATAGKPLLYFLRFAHEFNGSWYPHSVYAGQEANFRTAIKRYRTAQQELFPEAKLVLCTNKDTSQPTNSIDWRACVPGGPSDTAAGPVSQWLDCGAADWYNQYSGAKTKAQWDAEILLNDSKGAPKGLERHRAFWQAQGLPFAVPEWDNNAKLPEGAGDVPDVIDWYYDWFQSHSPANLASPQAGELWYEILFGSDPGQPQIQLYPSTQQPLTAARYTQKVWPSVW